MLDVTEVRPYLDVFEEEQTPSHEAQAQSAGGTAQVVLSRRVSRAAVFLRQRFDAPEYAHIIREFQVFCPEDHMDALQGRRLAPVPETKVAWLMESDYFGEPRPCRGPLSAQELYNGLKRWEHQPDDRRHIVYITDLDYWTVPAVALTATSIQTPLLRDCIRRHLKSGSTIRCLTTERRFAPFVFEFHLPYYTWRTHGSDESVPEDLRKCQDDLPLRMRQSATYLFNAATKPHTAEESIYKAQVSLLVTGQSHDIWCAFCFVDTFFDGVDSLDGVKHCQRIRTGAFERDPLTRFSKNTTLPVLDPRLYFLDCLVAWSCHVKEEWENLVEIIEPTINRQIEKRGLANPLAYSLGSEQEHIATITEDYKWTCNVTRLLTQLESALTPTMEALDKFLQHPEPVLQGVLTPDSAFEATYPRPPPHARTGQNSRNQAGVKRTLEGCHRRVASIGEVYRELRQSHTTVAKLVRLCDISRSQTIKFELYLQLQGIQSIHIQKESSVLFGVCTPLIMAGTIQQTGFVTFQPRLIFVSMTLFFGLIIWIVKPLSRQILMLLNTYSERARKWRDCFFARDQRAGDAGEPLQQGYSTAVSRLLGRHPTRDVRRRSGTEHQNAV